MWTTLTSVILSCFMLLRVCIELCCWVGLLWTVLMVFFTIGIGWNLHLHIQSHSCSGRIDTYIWTAQPGN